MTTYNNTPEPPYPALLLSGVLAYAFGSKNANLPPCHMKITNVSRTTNVVTLNVIVVEGNIPAFGDLISVAGTSAGSGGANTSNTPVALSAVAINATTGVGTVQYTLNGSNIVSVADFGDAYTAIPEIAQTLPASLKSAAFAIQNRIGGGYGISWSYNCPSAPGAISVQLEGAINDVDSEYEIIGSAQTTTSGSTGTFATVPELVNFVRLNVTSATGGSSPTIVGKLLQA